MECRVRSLNESSGRAEASIPTGKVESVCREWLVREDGVLAYKLQSEEIQHHYGNNKEKNQLVRSDIQEARVIQRSEEEEAELMQRAYEEMLMEQEQTDALIAKQIQDKLLQEELEKQRQIEEEDKRIALEIQKREKLKIQKKREEREVRQLEKMRIAKSEFSEPPSPSTIGIAVASTREASTSPLDQDFSELCIEPPPDLTEEELRKFREHQDAELAKYLQEQELKSQAANTNDQKLAIEAQDRELARLLQENERAKARKAKEKAKQKALLQQQHQQNGGHTTDQLERRFSNNSCEEQSPSHLEVRMKDNEIYSSVETYKTLSPSYSCQSADNVAMALDPTFTQTKLPFESPSTIYGSSKNNNVSSRAHYQRDTLCVSHGISEDIFAADANNDSIAPPYMPIQGQRRPQTLEKLKKNKKHKDNCKTQ